MIKAEDLIGMSFKIEKCELCGWFVRCPKCGNNSCNGGFGEVDGKECDVCNVAYVIQDAINKVTASE